MDHLASLLLKMTLFALCVYVPVSGCPDAVTAVARDSWAWTALVACVGGAVVPFEPTVGILVMTLAFIVRMYAEACEQGGASAIDRPADFKAPNQPPRARSPVAAPQQPSWQPASAKPRPPESAKPQPPTEQASDPPDPVHQILPDTGATATGAEDMYRALAAQIGFLSDEDLASMQSNAVPGGGATPPPALGPSSYTAQGLLRGAPEPVSR